MVKSEKRILILEIVLSIIFLLNIFVKRIFNEYMILFIILIAMGIINFLMGYEKDRDINKITKKQIIKYVVFYCFGFLVIEYGLGLILGYIKSPYKRDLLSIFSNVFSTVLIILSSEHFRYMIVSKGKNKKIILILSVLLFVLIDSSIFVKLYDLKELDDLLSFSTAVVLPSIFKNFILTILTYKYGFKQNIAYRLIMELYIYIVPFTPNLGIYLDSVLLMAFPIILSRIVAYGFDKEKKKDYRDNNSIKRKIITAVAILITSILIMLNSNLFRFWTAAVGSGSMEPTIKIGDAILVDKSYQKHLNKLKVGDILVFKIGKKIFTHRIIKIEEDNGNYSINTKGDRKGQLEDNWTVTNKDVIGIVKFRIKYIGYPTVWLSRILEVN